MQAICKSCILILDFGSQYTQLIARRIRELGIYCEILTWNVTEKHIRTLNPNGIILSGGPSNATKDYSPYAPQYVFEAQIPILGICYGMQAMIVQLGGYVETTNKREFGYAQVKIEKNNILTDHLQDEFTPDGKPLLNVWMSHSDNVTVIPQGFINVASTKNCQFAIVINEKKRFYGVQFHPEVTHTHQGVHILKRFALNICQCKTMWTSVNIIDSTITAIRKQVGNDKVILGISGGIDSSVTALLLRQAIGENLICIFIDNGLLRLNEAQWVIDTFNNCFNIDVIHIKSEQRFLNALKGVYDPEIKRKIIGQIFIEIFEEEALKHNNVRWLAQGTIYPDVIESVKSCINTSHIIKSHHNVGGLPETMKLRLIEPLRVLFKDEIRKIGLALNLPHDLIHKHPFPGPGLGVRVLGEVKKEYCDILRHVDSIFIEELRIVNLYDKISQAFSIFIPVRSVSIMGDNRKYDWVISLRAVETVDFMTAKWINLPYKILNNISNRIINEVNGVSRVVYDISNKPPATIEWE